MMELQSIIAGVVALHCQTICNRVKARWSGQSGIQGNAEIHSDLPSIVSTLVTATIEAKGSKAWISEFGSGSSMDKSSPYFQEYLSNGNVNSWRFHNLSMPIMGRSAGDYTDLDGKTRISTGAMAGLDLERDGDSRFQPKLPQHIIREEVQRGEAELVIAVQAAVAGYMVAQMTMQTEIYL